MGTFSLIITTIKFTKLNPMHLFRSKRSPPSSVVAAVSGDWSGHFRRELAEAFRLIDRDDDGIVSAAELEAVLSRLAGAPPPGLEGVAAALLGGDRISVEELAKRVGSGLGAGCEQEELREAFAVFDEDGDGKISAEELLRVFAAIGDERCTLEECRRMIAGVDGNGDGFVCFEDFSRMMHLQLCGHEDCNML